MSTHLALTPTVPRTLTDLAARQHGFVSLGQVHDVAGLSRSAWRSQLAQGDWEPVSPRVFRRSGAPPSPHGLVVAAALDVGPLAFASHETAASLWGAAGFSLDPVNLLVLRGGRQTPTELAVTHRPRHLPEPFATVLDGVPVVRPALVLLQVAGRVHPERLRRLFDRLWSRRLVSAPSVRAELAPLMHRGRAGTAALRELLDSYPEDYVPPATNLESRARVVLERAGLGPFRGQVDVGTEAGWCGRVDLLSTRLPLVVEVDSETFHSALSSLDDDEARAERLTRAGFDVVRVTDAQLWHRPDEAVAAVRAAERRCASSVRRVG